MSVHHPSGQKKKKYIVFIYFFQKQKFSMDYMCSAEEARVSAAEDGQQKEGKSMYAAKPEDCKEVK